MGGRFFLQMYFVQPSNVVKRIYPGALWRADSTKSVIYLTFDDGPVAGVTNGVLDVLKEKQVAATFFCVGENAVKNKLLFERITQEGHAVGNHTFHHLNGWNSSTPAYMNNVLQCEQAFHSTLFRPPYGKLKRSQFQQLRKKFRIVLWDVLSGDYDSNTSPEKCLQNACAYLRNGSVVVFHDSIKAQQKMEFALPRFIDFAKENGFEFALFE